MARFFDTLVRHTAGLVLLFGTLTAAGCGDPTGSVSGTVSYKGTTLGNGTVTFVGKNDQRESSLIAADGTYTIPKAPVGTVKVLVETFDQMTPQEQGGAKDAANVPEPKGGRVTEEQGHYVQIDAKYKDPTTTTVTYTVKKGKQRFNIELD